MSGSRDLFERENARDATASPDSVIVLDTAPDASQSSTEKFDANSIENPAASKTPAEDIVNSQDSASKLNQDGDTRDLVEQNPSDHAQAVVAGVVEECVANVVAAAERPSTSTSSACPELIKTPPGVTGRPAYLVNAVNTLRSSPARAILGEEFSHVIAYCPKIDFSDGSSTGVLGHYKLCGVQEINATYPLTDWDMELDMYKNRWRTWVKPIQVLVAGDKYEDASLFCRIRAGAPMDIVKEIPCKLNRHLDMYRDHVRNGIAEEWNAQEQWRIFPRQPGTVYKIVKMPNGSLDLRDIMKELLPEGYDTDWEMRNAPVPLIKRSDQSPVHEPILNSNNWTISISSTLVFIKLQRRSLEPNQNETFDQSHESQKNILIFSYCVNLL